MKYKKEEFMDYFHKNNKKEAVEWALSALERSEITMEELYVDVLLEALHSIDECEEGNPECIWNEHVKTGIVRTVVECCYPHLLSRLKVLGKEHGKVILLCPEKELHEMGSRMAADFFLLAGYKSIFIGANTPREQALSAIKIERPEYLVISVTDYYLLSEAKKLLELIRPHLGKTKVLLAGRAFDRNPSVAQDFVGSGVLHQLTEILSFGEGE